MNGVLEATNPIQYNCNLMAEDQVRFRKQMFYCVVPQSRMYPLTLSVKK